MQTPLKTFGIRLPKACLSWLCILVIQYVHAQVCTNPVNVIYGIDNAGNILPITVATGVVGAPINPAYGTAAVNPNGVGYNSVNGKFYFFKRPPSHPAQEFVSVDPATGIVAVLANCPTTYAVYVGCLTPDGTGYYCWDSQARLYYYRILTNTWTLITTDIRDQYGKDVDSILRAHGSGDAAISGSGHLIMLPSSNTRYGVFRANAPLPTSPVASLIVRELLPMTVPPAKFVGISFNSTGQIFLSTATGDKRLFRLENNMTLTYVSTLTTSMEDLTSCNYPFGVLPVRLDNFSVKLKNAGVLLNWEATQSTEIPGYTIEHSTDGNHWEKIGYVNKMDLQTFSFFHNNPSSGKNHYRLSMETITGLQKFSEPKTISVAYNAAVAIWPNPTPGNIWIRTDGISKATLFDQTGRIMKEFYTAAGSTNVDLHALPSGTYFVRISAGNNYTFNFRIVKK